MTAAQQHIEPATPLDAALDYARRGWRVIPIPPGLKFPKGHPAWQREGSTDEAKIRHWWSQAPEHGIGIVTGATSGIWVLDVDVADGKSGDETLADLEAGYGPLPATYEVVTGSGGRHIYFAWPDGAQVIRNSASGRLGPGLDVRGEGGFVVAPPSLHASGSAYEPEASAPDHVAPAPAWILGLLDEPAPDTTRAAPSPATGDRPGDLWAASTTWAQILEDDGWTLHHVDHSGEEHWTRPGKERRDGTSATTGYMGSDVLKVFTSSMTGAGLQAEQTYSKLGYLAATRFGGTSNQSMAAAASALRAQGFYAAPAPGLADMLGATLTGTEGGGLPGGAVMPPAPDPWDAPRPLPGPAPLPAFPIDSLPSWAQAHAVGAADQVQVPVDLAAMLIIGSLSAAATGRARVHVSPNWVEPTNLYLVTAMRSGAGKSPADKLCCEWLRKWQRERIALAMPEYEKGRQLLRLAEKKHANLERNALDEQEVLNAMSAVTTARDAVPSLPRLIADDATPEAVVMLLKAHGERLAIMSTEADLFDMVMKGKVGQRANLNVYLKAWSGDSMPKDRKGGSEAGPEWTELQAPLMTVAITVQPSVLARLQGDDEMVSRGFAARFMFSMPADLIGRRDQSRRFRSERLATIDAYEAEATRLATRWGQWANPADLRFSKPAAALLEAFLVDIEPRLAGDADLQHLGEWANKLHGSIARYAGILHLAEGRETGAEVQPDIVQRAITLGGYWLDHAVAVLGLEVERTVEQAEVVMAWIAGQGVGQISLTRAREAIRRPAIGLDKVADFVPAFELLVELGWLRPAGRADWRSGIGVRGEKSPDFAVWPECIGQPRRVKVPGERRTEPMEESFSLSFPSSTPPYPLGAPSSVLSVLDDDDPWDLGLGDDGSAS